MNEETLQTPLEIEAQAQATAEAADDYNPENVDILRDAAHIRARPGMYIGDTGTKGLHHLVYELVYNSVDEALAGFCNNIHVKIHVDGSLSVADDGRGIPVDIHPEGRQVDAGSGAHHRRRRRQVRQAHLQDLRRACTAWAPRRSPPCREWTEAEVRRNGKVYVQEYERGKPTTEVKELGASPGNRTGTKITFKPDPEIFHDATFDYDTLENRLRELAFLNKGLAIKLTDERIGKEETFVYEGGIAEFVEYLNRTEETLHKVALRRQDGRRRPRRGRLPVHRPARRSASAATPTTPTTPAAARTCPASAPP